MKKLTDEVLKARADRKAQAERQGQKFKKEQVKREAEEREFVEDVKTRYPEQFAEFNRLKELRAEYEAEDVEERLHWLQMELVHGSKWIWDDIKNALIEFSAAEQAIINEVASKYYEGLEKRLCAGEKVNPSSEELIALVEEAGVDTYERCDNIFFYTCINVHHSTRLFELANDRVDEDVPLELSY